MMDELLFKNDAESGVPMVHNIRDAASPTAIFLDPPQIFDKAIVAYWREKDLTIYGYEELVLALSSDESELTIDEAIEWINFNTLRALPYYEKAPIVVYNAMALKIFVARAAIPELNETVEQNIAKMNYHNNSEWDDDHWTFLNTVSILGA